MTTTARRAQTIRPFESLTEVLARVDWTSRAVSHPVTWLQLAAAADSQGCTAPGSGNGQLAPHSAAAITCLAETLRAGYLEQVAVAGGPVVAPNWGGIARHAEAAGWVLQGRRAAA
jgi:hypothetical protein